MMIKNFSADQLSAFQAYTRLTVVAHAKGKRKIIRLTKIMK